MELVKILMKNLLSKLDKAGDSLHEGFVTTGLGRRGAAVFFLLWDSLLPPSAGNFFWIGLLALVLVVLGASDIPTSGPFFLDTSLLLRLAHGQSIAAFAK